MVDSAENPLSILSRFRSFRDPAPWEDPIAFEAYQYVCRWEGLPELKGTALSPNTTQVHLAQEDLTYFPELCPSTFFPDPRVAHTCVTVVTPQSLSHLHPSRMSGHLEKFVANLAEVVTKKVAVLVGGDQRDRKSRDQRWGAHTLLYKYGFTIKEYPELYGSHKVDPIERRSVLLPDGVLVITSMGNSRPATNIYPW